MSTSLKDDARGASPEPNDPIDHRTEPHGSMNGDAVPVLPGVDASPGRVDEQTALYEFTDRLYRARSERDICDAALNAISRALQCERSSILTFDHSGVMRFIAWRGLSDDYRRAVEGHSPWARDAKEPQPICVENVDEADLPETLKATVKAEGIGACAFVPLVAKGELIGKFMTYYDAPHVFSKAEIDLAVTIARQLGFGIERMRAEEALRESKERLAAELDATRQLQNISTQLIHENDTQALYEKILDAAVAIMRSDFASMQMFHPERGELQLLAHKGFDPSSVAFWQWVRPGVGCICGAAWPAASVRLYRMSSAAISWPEPKTLRPIARRACARCSPRPWSPALVVCWA